MRKQLPLISVLMLIGISAAISILHSPPKSKKLGHFWRLPALHDGRIKPMDTIAADSLTFIGGDTSIRDENGEAKTAIEWFAELTLDATLAKTRHCFRISNKEIRNLIEQDGAQGIVPKEPFWKTLPGSQDASVLYSYAELADSRDKIQSYAAIASSLDEDRRSRFQNDTIKLLESIRLFERLSQSIHHNTTTSFASELAELERFVPLGILATGNQSAGIQYNEENYSDMMHMRFLYSSFEENNRFYPIVQSADAGSTSWRAIATLFDDAVESGSAGDLAWSYAYMVDAYRNGEYDEFVRYSERAWQIARIESPSASLSATIEAWMRLFAPFRTSSIAYASAFIAAFLSWVRWPKTLRNTALALMLSGLVFHTLGLAACAYILKTPPLASHFLTLLSASWWAVLLALLLERKYNNAVARVAGSLIGFGTLLAALRLDWKGDALRTLPAPLDNAFWLTMHVGSISLGFAAIMLAGVIGIVFIISAHTTSRLKIGSQIRLENTAINLIRIGTLFAATGTLFGSMWSERVFGHFWSWEPKECGTLILLVWNAIILLAHSDELIKARGVMVSAVFGNIIALFTWVGVNMLGEGWHSYGFVQHEFATLALFAFAHVLILLLGSISPTRWKSPTPDYAIK